MMQFKYVIYLIKVYEYIVFNEYFTFKVII